MSRFSKFHGTATKSGKKVLGSIHPELKAASTKDKFVLNAVALKLLGIKPGKDRVVLYDFAGQEGVTNETRFFIAKGGADSNGAEHGALVGKNGVFSYGEIWSAYHMGEISVTAARPDDMIAVGKVIRTEEVQAKNDDGSPKVDKKGKPVMTGGAIIANQLILGNLEIALMPNPEYDADDEDSKEFIELRGEEIEDGLFADVYAVKSLRVVAHDPRTEEKDTDGLVAPEEIGDTEPASNVEGGDEVQPSRRRK